MQALQALKVAPDAAVLVGDSATDVAAARAAGVACVGYANKPGKAERLAAAGADAIVTDMTDLAGVLARTRRPVSQLPWVDSGGGPLIAVPTSALGEWTGASMDDGDSWGDYDRACQVDGFVGVLDVGADQALVLADEPASTTYLPDRRIFVRWIYANSEAEVVRLVPRALKIADWKDAGTWTTSGPPSCSTPATPATGWSTEDERADGPLGILEPGTSPADRPRDGVDGLLLADDPLVQRVLHVQQPLRLLLGDAGDGHAGPHRDDLGDVLFGRRRRVSGHARLPVAAQLVELARAEVSASRSAGRTLVVLVVDGRFLLLGDALEFLLGRRAARAARSCGAGARGWPPRR